MLGGSLDPAQRAQAGTSGRDSAQPCYGIQIAQHTPADGAFSARFYGAR